jgi:hypothetical protein
MLQRLMHRLQMKTLLVLAGQVLGQLQQSPQTKQQVQLQLQGCLLVPAAAACRHQAPAQHPVQQQQQQVRMVVPAAPQASQPASKARQVAGPGPSSTSPNQTAARRVCCLLRSRRAAMIA